MWRSIGKGVLSKTIDVKVQALLCLNFDVNRFGKYSFSHGNVTYAIEDICSDCHYPIFSNTIIHGKSFDVNFWRKLFEKRLFPMGSIQIIDNNNQNTLMFLPFNLYFY